MSWCGEDELKSTSIAVSMREKEGDVGLMGDSCRTAVLYIRYPSHLLTEHIASCELLFKENSLLTIGVKARRMTAKRK